MAFRSELLTVFKIYFRNFSKSTCVPVPQTKVPKPVILKTDGFMPNSKYLVSVVPDLHFPNIKRFFSVLKLKQNAFPLEWDASWKDNKTGNSKSCYKYCKDKHKHRSCMIFLNWRNLQLVQSFNQNLWAKTLRNFRIHGRITAFWVLWRIF